MNAIDFESRLQNLIFLSESEQGIDLFTTEYESLLAEVKAGENQKQRKEMALAMQKTLFKQFLFLQYQWRQEKGLVPKHEQGKSSHVN
jgi:hypothetical protein